MVGLFLQVGIIYHCAFHYIYGYMRRMMFGERGWYWPYWPPDGARLAKRASVVWENNIYLS